MLRRWWETREHQTTDERWIPEVHLFEEVPGGLDQLRLLGPPGLAFDNREDAKAWSNAMAAKWLRDQSG